jgi:hypothetical protein
VPAVVKRHAVAGCRRTQTRPNDLDWPLTPLPAAAPALEKIRDEHQSERSRKAAAKYLEQIAREVG